MASFTMPFCFPFGEDGEDVIPTTGDVWLVNLRPAPEEANVRLLSPITFSIRDFGGFVDPAAVKVAIGYSKIYGRGEKFFDQAIPNTVRQSITEPLTNREPLLSVGGTTDKYVSLKKVTSNPERTVYFTKVQVDDIRAFRNLMASTLLTPIVAPNEGSNTFKGPLFGIEIGPRNTAAYVFFKTISGARKIFLTGPYTPSLSLNPQHSAFYDWTLNSRYTLSWNESRGLVQLYASNNILILSVPLTDFPQFGVLSSRHVDPDQYAVVYGIEGDANVEARISAISFTDNIAYPVLTSPVRPNAMNTVFRPADLVRTVAGVDPRKDLLSPWYDDNVHFDDEDEAGAAKMGRRGFQLARVTTNPTRSVAIFREEPSFLNDSVAGLFVSLKFVATSTQLDGDAAGFGIVIYDGTSLIEIACFQSAGIRYVGIRKDAGDRTILDDDNQFFAVYDWTVPNTLRFAIDGQMDRILLYSGADLSVPILNVPLDRTALPPLPFGDPELGSLDTPYIAVGHFVPVFTAGSMYIEEIIYNHAYQTWDSNEGIVPDSVDLGSLIWVPASVGSPVAPSEPVVEAITIDCAGDQTFIYTRSADTDALRGASMEVKVAIPSSEKLERTGDVVVLDDGLRSFILTFTETEEGRFACLALRAGLGSFQEIVGFDGPGKDISFRVDWTKPHIYRMERRPFEGVFIFLDNDPTPKIVYPEAKLNQLPDTIYSTPTLAFGHMALNAPSTAKWYFVRAFFTTGLEGSFKRNAPDLTLKDDLFATESMILVEAGDVSPTPPPPSAIISAYTIDGETLITSPHSVTTAETHFDDTLYNVVCDWLDIPGTTSKVGLSGRFVIGPNPVTLRVRVGARPTVNNSSTDVVGTIVLTIDLPASTTSDIGVVSAEFPKPTGAFQYSNLTVTAQATGGSSTVAPAGMVVGVVPGADGIGQGLMLSSGRGTSPTIGEAVQAGNGYEWIVDFDQFAGVANLRFGFAAYEDPAFGGDHLTVRIRVGGTDYTPNGTIVVTATDPNSSQSPNEWIIGGSAVVANTFTGPQFVKLTWDGRAGPGRPTLIIVEA